MAPSGHGGQEQLGESNRLAVTPTPSPKERFAKRQVLDETARPQAAVRNPGRGYTAAQRASAQHLIDIHNHLRNELRDVREMTDRVIAGTLSAGEARDHLDTLTLRQNNWTLGAYCQKYCRLLTGHHTFEDQTMLSHLRRSVPELDPVITRLEEEHLSIHEVIEMVDGALVAFVGDMATVSQLREAVDLLTDTLLSHLSYEEHQLVEPLACFGYGYDLSTLARSESTRRS